MKSVFITGAGGFVGSRLVSFLQQRGYSVIAGVRNRARKLAYERQQSRAVVCDVSDPINTARAVASVRPDGVIHLAGPARADDIADEPLTGYQGIVTAWANLLDAVRRTVPRAKVVLASACDVYGHAASNGQATREDTELAPVSTFGSLKATAETIAHTFHRDYHLDVTIARPFQYTGAGQPGRFYFAGAAERLSTWDAAAGDVLQWPDLECRRDLLHVDDVVAAYERLLVEGQPNETYNICSGQTQTCHELLQALVNASGRSIRLESAPTDGEPANIPVYWGDNQKLRALGWNPEQTATRALQDLWTSYANAPQQPELAAPSGAA